MTRKELVKLLITTPDGKERGEIIEKIEAIDNISNK